MEHEKITQCFNYLLTVVNEKSLIFNGKILEMARKSLVLKNQYSALARSDFWVNNGLFDWRWRGRFDKNALASVGEQVEGFNGMIL